MQKISVVEDPELTRQHAAELPCWPSIVEIRTTTGDRIQRATSAPRGHPYNPMSDDDLEAKFWALVDDVMSHEQGRAFLDTVWALHDLTDISQFTQAFRTMRDPSLRAGADTRDG
jgi:2-methylcitrate dehydratase